MDRQDPGYLQCESMKLTSAENCSNLIPSNFAVTKTMPGCLIASAKPCFWILASPIWSPPNDTKADSNMINSRSQCRHWDSLEGNRFHIGSNQRRWEWNLHLFRLLLWNLFRWQHMSMIWHCCTSCVILEMQHIFRYRIEIHESVHVRQAMSKSEQWTLQRKRENSSLHWSRCQTYLGTQRFDEPVLKEERVNRYSEVLPSDTYSKTTRNGWGGEPIPISP